MNAGWPWLDQDMIDDLNGKPYRDGPALEKGDRVSFEIDGEVHYGVLDDSVTDIATGVTTITMMGDDASKALNAIPKPSSTPPMWAHDPTRSRRPKRKKSQPTRQGIA